MAIRERFRFAFDSLKKCVLMEPKNNFFFSPHLIYQNLLVIYFATRDGDIENSFKQILYIPNHFRKVINKICYMNVGVKQLCYVMQGHENSYECRIFSSVYINKCKSKLLNRETWNLFSSAHQAIKSCDFESDPDGMRLFINENISSVTQHKIPNLLPQNSIDSKTDIVLANAIYLKGQLLSCEQDETLRLDDTLDASKCEIKNDNQSADKDENKEPKIFLTEIPLKEDKISVFFVRSTPSTELRTTVAENDVIIKLMEYLTTDRGYRKLRRLLDKKSRKQTRIFSTFKIEHNLGLNEFLEMLGVPKLTPSGRAELLAFTHDGFLTLGNAVHQASIEMTENSITATASNAFFTANSNCQHVQTTDIPADISLPCICLVYDKVHHNILFCGVLWNLIQDKIVMV